MFQARSVLHFDLDVGTHKPVHKFFVNRHSRCRPAEEPFGSLRGQVDTAVTARTSVVVMPVGTVEGDPALGNVGHPWYTREVKSACGEIASRHVAGGTFMECNVIANGRGVGAAA